MEQYTVTGMSCAACSARVEKAVNAVPGVESCSVSLLTNSMGVEGTASQQEIIAAVEKAGYGASLKSRGRSSERAESDRAAGANEGMAPDTAAQLEALADHETPVLRRRLITSLVFLLVLMYLSMGHMMWGWPVPAVLADNHIAMGLTELLLTAIIMVINQKFFISGYQALWHGAPNMDTLVALGSSAAFIYSTAVLFLMTDAQVRGDTDAVMSYMHEFYFESAAMILTLITVGKMLEAHSKGKTTDALKSLMRLAPQKAVVVRDGHEETVSIEAVRKGDIFLVRPGESVPVDGVVLEGSSAVNEAALTGESIPVDKAEGSLVSAATVNQSGFLRCEATRVGEDTTLSQIIQMVSDAAATKAPIAKIADKVSGIFVPCVITIAVITTIVWLLTGHTVGYALARGISVLVISCPCALGLATPVAIMVGNGMGAKSGILFKTAASLEETGRVQIVALDKTGTITKGEPKVTGLYPADGVSEEMLIRLAAALEAHSEHPLAHAIMEYAAERSIRYPDTKDFQALPGNGLRAAFTDNDYRHLLHEDNSSRLQNEDVSSVLSDDVHILNGGSFKYIQTIASVDSKLEAEAEACAEEGRTPLFFAMDDVLLGVIAVADVIKEDSSQAIKELRGMGIHVVMLTGDNEKTAAAIGREAGVDEVAAGVLPEGKEQAVRRMQEKGKVAMVGDGINDAPALTRADIGIAIGAGTDVAIDAADVVLMKSNLLDVAAAIRLSRATLRNIHQNLFWAFFYNTIGIPLAAGVWIPLFHLELDPMFGAAAMSLSSFCVVTNALRLNLFRMYDAGRDKMHKRRITGNVLEGAVPDTDINNKKSEDEKMKKTMKIEGMMCSHCEAAVKKALEALEQVDTAEVSHETGTAVVTLNSEVEDAVLKKAVEDKDYTVASIA